MALPTAAVTLLSLEIQRAELSASGGTSGGYGGPSSA